MYAPNQWFEITLVGTCAGQDIINHFYYAQPQFIEPYEGSILDVGNDFASIVLPDLVEVVSTSTIFTELLLEEHVSGSAVASYSILGGGGGLRVGESMPPFVAWGFKSIRTSREVKSAQKRIGVPVESDISVNDATPGALTLLGALASALERPFSPANSGVTGLVPVAITRVDTTVTPHVKRPIPLFEAILDWTYSKVTSQVSRRRN